MIPLTFAEKNTPYFIKRIQGKDEARRHLNNLGFIEGEEISVINELAGNLIIAVKDSRVAIDREMNSGKWTAFAITYQCVAAYIVGLIVYQLGMAFTGSFGIGTLFGVAALAFVVYMLFRKDKYRI